jgi:HK97 family phage major capsid protein
MDLSDVMKGVGALEAKLNAYAEKAEQEIKAAGTVSVETKNAINALGTQQREIADRLLMLEQKQGAPRGNEGGVQTMGAEFTAADQYKAFVGGQVRTVRIELKNTTVGSDTTVAPDRRPGVTSGAFRRFLVEAAMNALPTSSNAVEFTREATFVNNAAETAEASAKPETDVTFNLQTAAVRTIAHWTRISRQLAADAPAVAAYINTRMRYGVDLRVENQLINGNGTGANLSGIFNTGNFTPHGYTAATMTAWVANAQRFDLIRRVIGDLQAADYPPNAILLNPVDWAVIEVLKDSQARYLLGNPGSASAPSIWGIPVIPTNAVTADTFLVGALDMAATIYNRDGVAVALSEEDASNFTTNLVTIRAERRLALAIERPAALRGGDLTPA